MSIMRREGNEGSTKLEPFDRSFFEGLRPFDAWRHLLDDDDTIKVEEYMDGNELVVRAEIPGVDPEKDIDVSIEDGALRIRAERREEHTTKERRMRRSELRYGSFSRVIPLPPGAKESDIKAAYKDGVLEVRTPIDEDTTNRSKIPIRRE